MKISVGADHAGADLRTALVAHLQSKGVTVNDHGTAAHESVDYPDYAHLVAHDVASKRCDVGILVCSTGIGMSIAANKVDGVRAALVYNEDAATLCREHNDANVLCLGAKYQTPEQAAQIADIFLNTAFLGGRHARRVAKIATQS